MEVQKQNNTEEQQKLIDKQKLNQEFGEIYKKIDDDLNLQCQVCWEVQLDKIPYTCQMGQCTQVICEDCYKKLDQRGKQQCSVCKGEKEDGSSCFFKNQFLLKLVQNYLVRCENHDQGCKKRTKCDVNSKQAHQNECFYSYTICQKENCGERIQIKDQAEHDKQCKENAATKYHFQGNKQKSLELNQQLIKQQPKDIKFYQRIAQLCIQTYRYYNAYLYADKGLELDQNDLKLNFIYGKSLVYISKNQNELEIAIKRLQYNLEKSKSYKSKQNIENLIQKAQEKQLKYSKQTIGNEGIKNKNEKSFINSNKTQTTQLTSQNKPKIINSNSQKQQQQFQKQEPNMEQVIKPLKEQNEEKEPQQIQKQNIQQQPKSLFDQKAAINNKKEATNIKPINNIFQNKTSNSSNLFGMDNMQFKQAQPVK